MKVIGLSSYGALLYSLHKTLDYCLLNQMMLPEYPRQDNEPGLPSVLSLEKGCVWGDEQILSMYQIILRFTNVEQDPIEYPTGLNDEI